MANLDSILFRGLLSHQYLEKHNLKYTDISHSQVQQLRDVRIIKGIPLHQYVPLYFNPKNPMLFLRRSYQTDLIILGIDPQVLFQPYTIFSDGNAASEKTTFYDANLTNLPHLNWEIILNSSNWSNQPDGKRIRCAEVLVYPRIAVAKILKIFCYNQETLSKLQHLPITIEVNHHLYF